ncbi:MAG: glycerophosphodiester phosphodiesterase [Flavobacteriales bacterium]|nr:glycerophosphodiester phosphodiesterase [Flavobacteriales bacterium]
MKFLTLLFAFFQVTTIVAQSTKTPIFGHRGCRGIYPENTIIAFQEALKLGVDGIELDVVVNAQKQLVISHEPYFKKEYCLTPNKKPIKDEKEHNIYKMNQDEISWFDCGSIGNPKFPEQKKMPAYKPLLSDFFKEVDLGDKILLFEIKSEKEEYGISQPYPKEFVDLILAETKDFKMQENLIFMCFDAAILEELHKRGVTNKMVYLTYKPKSAKKLLKEITFQPYALGMFHATASKAAINYAHSKNIKVFTWTVNDAKTGKKLIERGVDGLITDFPKLMD